MKALQKKLAVLPMLILAAGLALGACTTGPFGLAQPAPTPLPTVIQAGVVSAEGSLMPVRSTALGFMANGKLGEILVSEGQAVHQGEVMATLGEREPLEAALSQARLEQLSAQQALHNLMDSADLLRTQSAQALDDAQHALEDLEDTHDLQRAAAHEALIRAQNIYSDTLDFRDFLVDIPNSQEAVDARQDYEDAEARVDHLRKLYEGIPGDPRTNPIKAGALLELKVARFQRDRAKYIHDLYGDKPTDRELEEVDSKVELALAQLEEAQRSYDRLDEGPDPDLKALLEARVDDAQRVFDAHQDGPDPDDLALAVARLDNAGAQVAAAQSALEKVELAAPYDATVVDVNDLEPGEIIAAGSMVVVLADYSKWVVETRDLTELDVVEVFVGQQTTVTPDALPELKLAGVVESIDLAPKERSGDILYTVHIRLEEADPLLRWGMTVYVVFGP